MDIKEKIRAIKYARSPEIRWLTNTFTGLRQMKSDDTPGRVYCTIGSKIHFEYNHITNAILCRFEIPDYLRKKYGIGYDKSVIILKDMLIEKYEAIGKLKSSEASLADVEFLWQLVQYRDWDLSKVKNCGRKSLNEIGLQLKIFSAV